MQINDSQIKLVKILNLLFYDFNEFHNLAIMHHVKLAN